MVCKTHAIVCLKEVIKNLQYLIQDHGRRKPHLFCGPFEVGRSSSIYTRAGRYGSSSFFAKSQSKDQKPRTFDSYSTEDRPISHGRETDASEAGNVEYQKHEPLEYGPEKPHRRDIEPDRAWLKKSPQTSRLHGSKVKSLSTTADRTPSLHHSKIEGMERQRIQSKSAMQDFDFSQPKQLSVDSPSSRRADTLPNPSEQWQIQKAALAKKFGASGWQPRKRLSPDALDGIRSLHAHDPEKHSTSALADQFQVSPEAIRRILKSKWRPNEDEEEDRRLRWEKRGQQIWSQMSELGVKPPKKWRFIGAPESISRQWRGGDGASANSDTKPEYVPLADRIY